MLYSYLKGSIKNILNHKTFSIINILGFAFSFSVFLTILLFVIYEKSYDTHYTNSDSIYRLIDVEKNSSSIDYRVRNIISEQFPTVENICLYNEVEERIPVTYNNFGYELYRMASVDSNFFKVFDLEFIHGNSQIPFESPNSIVLTQSSAQHLFDKENPIGKEIILAGHYPLIVSAVIKDFPDNSSFDPSILVNAEKEEFKWETYMADREDRSSYRWVFRIYMKLKAHVSPKTTAESFNTNISTLQPYVKKAGLLPLKDIYLYDQTEGSITKRGNPEFITLLSLIGAAILFMSISNFINLTLGYQKKRIKEIGVRKILGASKFHISIRFFIETTTIVFLAFILSIIIFSINYPVFKNMFGAHISTSLLYEFPTNIALIASILLICILTSLYPALLFSKINTSNMSTKSMLFVGPTKYPRYILTIFQFVVSITLIFYTTIIWKQIGFSSNKNLGFSSEQLLKIGLPPDLDSTVYNRSLVFINDLRMHSNIASQTSSQGIPGEVRNYKKASNEDKKDRLSVLYADSAFLNTFDLEILQGRDFLQGDEGLSCIVNETAFKYLELNKQQSIKFSNGLELEVVGVVKDFHLNSLHHLIEPTVIIYNSQRIGHVSVRIKSSSVGATMEYIQKSWNKRFPDFQISYQFYDEWYNSMYDKEVRFGKILSTFSLLGIIISCIGILGLSIFNAEKRTKEIGIRKVNGATISNIIILLTKEYVFIIVIAYIIAIPIGYLLINDWLQGFAYKTSISIWSYLSTAIITFMVAWVSIAWQCLRAAKKNPAITLSQ